MAKKSYVILLASQKGGVGKTTVAINLAAALRYKKYSVLVIDTDTSTYSISGHLGIGNGINDYQKAMDMEIDVKDAIFAYQPIDIGFILGSESEEEDVPTAERISNFYGQVLKLGYDFIIIDCPPGLFRDELTRYINDVIIITTPDPTSVRSSARLSRHCIKFKLEHRLVINRVGFSRKYELDTGEVEAAYGDVASVIVPEDSVVQESAAKQKPAYMIDRGCSFSLAIDELARIYSLKLGEPEEEKTPPTERARKPSFFDRLGTWTFGSEK